MGVEGRVLGFGGFTHGHSIWTLGSTRRLSASLFAGLPDSVQFSRGIVRGGPSEERILHSRLFAEWSPRIDHVKPNTALTFPRNYLIAQADHFLPPSGIPIDPSPGPRRPILALSQATLSPRRLVVYLFGWSLVIRITNAFSPTGAADRSPGERPRERLEFNDQRGSTRDPRKC